MDAEKLEKRLNIDTGAAVTDAIHHPVLTEHEITLYMKRDDLLHPIISGNKWRKLKYTLCDALGDGATHLISMGGPYSNHLHALAYAAHCLGLQASGFIRGEEVDNATIRDLKDWGMSLKFISREAFRELREIKSHDSNIMGEQGYWIPEGAYQAQALQGVGEMLNEIEIDYDIITVPCGTATTLAGIAETLPENKQVLGFAALKSADFLNDDVSKLMSVTRSNWQINLDYHFGGFGKSDESLHAFIENFKTETNIQLEPLYTGKMLYGLFDLVKQGMFERGTRIIAIHTGGLQGFRDASGG